MPSNVTKEKAREYNQTYYQKHKDRLKEKRRRRYDTDPEYRKAIKRYAQTARINKKLRREAEYARLGKKAPGRGGALKIADYKIMVGDKEVIVKMYPVGYLAQQLGRKVQTIRNWERKGLFPRALYRSPGGLAGNRLYTEFQMEKIMSAYRKAYKVDGAKKVKTRIGQTIFPDLIRKLWKDYPLGIDPMEV
jgi:hypothetical protein